MLGTAMAASAATAEGTVEKQKPWPSERGATTKRAVAPGNQDLYPDG